MRDLNRNLIIGFFYLLHFYIADALEFDFNIIDHIYLDDGARPFVLYKVIRETIAQCWALHLFLRCLKNADSESPSRFSRFIFFSNLGVYFFFKFCFGVTHPIFWIIAFMPFNARVCVDVTNKVLYTRSKVLRFFYLLVLYVVIFCVMGYLYDFF
jgi:hypothetical protein